MRPSNFVLCLLTWCIVGAVSAEQHPQINVRADGVDAITAIQFDAVAAGLNQYNRDSAREFPGHVESARVFDAHHNVLSLADAGKSSDSGANGSPSSASEQNAGMSFRALEEEAEDLLKDILELSSDIEIIEERQRYPDKHQFLVLVSLEPTKFFDLDYVELVVDEQVVAAHHYTDSEVTALLRGGGHRLYLANLPAGVHNIKATFVGKVPRDPDYQREAVFSFIAGVSRTVIELYINSSENNGFPQLTVKEWN